MATRKKTTVTSKKTTATSKKKQRSKKDVAHDPLVITDDQQKDKVAASAEPTQPEVPTSEESQNDPVVSEHEDGCFDLGSVLSISEVEGCRANLMLALQAGNDISIDGGDIQQIDGAGLQLLVAFVKEAERMHVAVNWSGVSPVLQKASGRLGLTEALQINE
jgi:phospholipid transport system transporter-binding protein